jgi:RNA-directed DNA polymerase
MKPTTSSASVAVGTLPTFEDSFSPGRLDETYEELRIRRYDVISDGPRIQAGADRITLDEFHRDREMHLRAIHRKVIQGRFTFSPFLGVEIPKPGTKETRPISLSSIRDSVTQRALYEYLYPRVDPLLTESAFGYRSGRSAHDAITRIREHLRAGREWIVDADLSRFFDTVDHNLLMAKVNALRVDDRAKKLVYRFLRTGRVDAIQVAASRIRAHRQHRFQATLRSVGVPQGGVLSGLLSNLFLAEFDKAISASYEGYVRYADDFVICCKSDRACAAAYGYVKDALTPLKLSINTEKTRPCVHINAGIDFLGFRLNDKGVRVRGRNVHKFKQRIRDVIAKQKRRRTYDATLRELAWRLNYKIRGPNDLQCQRLGEHLGVKHPYRRCWIGFFRIVTDIGQIRRLDHWIRREVAAFMWRTHRKRVRYRTIQAAGLQSLVKTLYRTRQ